MNESQSTPSTSSVAQIIGIGLVIIGLLLAGWGIYQDSTAPPCPDPKDPGTSGGCQEPGLTELFGGISLFIIGIMVSSGTLIISRLKKAG
jgi:hypothetical protein